MDGLNKELCVGAHLFAKEVIRLVRKSGFLFTALYLNVLCHCSKLMPRKTGLLLPFPVSLTRSGYPRIIPSFHRSKVGKKDETSDLLVKLYLSFFTLARAIPLAKRLTNKRK